MMPSPSQRHWVLNVQRGFGFGCRLGSLPIFPTATTINIIITINSVIITMNIVRTIINTTVGIISGNGQVVDGVNAGRNKDGGNVSGNVRCRQCCSQCRSNVI
jgi:hypothetical protein